MDYRHSHLNRGSNYDATISAHPLDAYMAKCEAAYLREIVPQLTDSAGRYLDFACGTGRITQTVAPLVGQSFAVDVSETMLVEARRKCPSTRFLCVDLTQREADLGQFDLLTAFRFLGNAEDELRAAALRAMSNLVRKNGFLVVNNHRNPHAIWAILQRLNGATQETDLTYSKLKRMLGDYGFRVRHVRPIGFWIMRAKWQTPAVLCGHAAEVAERAFRHRAWAALAPDYVVVAQRR